jgi:translation initiation factor IF-1
VARENALKVEGVVVEVLPNKTFRVELVNGHRVLAYVAGRAQREIANFETGEKVMLQLSRYDLSEGRILVTANNLL